MKFLISPFLFFFTFNALSQSFSLSEKEYQKLHDKARFLINSNIDSSFIYANEIQKSNNPLHQSFAYGIKSYLYQLKGDSTKSNELYKKANVFLEKVPLGVERSKHHSYLLAYKGLSEWKRGNLKEALLFYEQGRKIAESNQDILQIIKFNYNIANLYGDASSYKLAIKEAKKSDLLLDRNRFKISKENYQNNKSNISISLGRFYESLYWLESNKKNLDSAKFFYNRTIIFSTNLIPNKINAKNGLANIYYIQDKYNEATKQYLNLINDMKENGLEVDNSQVYQSLAITYYANKKFDKALFYFNKYDSLYRIKPLDKSLFMDSNYYQAKIYEIKNQPRLALKYAKIYLDSFQPIEEKKSAKIEDFNSAITERDLEKEMLEIKNKYKSKVLLDNILMLIGLLVIPFLIILLFININKKKNTDKRINDLILEFEWSSLNKIDNELINDQNILLNPKKSTLVNLDEEKEKEILLKFNKLIEKNEFLKVGFTLSYVAGKIKTNTTYLSYVVNKKFEKSFSDYVNELKINYAINEMINNSTYRKYSTQAIAESVGFKNAISFTKSFNKRTGVTPAQFIKRLN